MTPMLNEAVLIVLAEGGLTIAGTRIALTRITLTRITLYDVMSLVGRLGVKFLEKFALNCVFLVNRNGSKN